MDEAKRSGHLWQDYRLTIFASGFVIYEGLAKVKSEGRSTFNVAPANLTRCVRTSGYGNSIADRDSPSRRVVLDTPQQRRQYAAQFIRLRLRGAEQVCRSSQSPRRLQGGTITVC
jgi:hypothetical protein